MSSCFVCLFFDGTADDSESAVASAPLRHLDVLLLFLLSHLCRICVHPRYSRERSRMWALVFSKAEVPAAQLRMVCQFVNELEVTVLPPYVPSEAERSDPGLYAANVREVRLFCAHEGFKIPCTLRGTLRFLRRDSC